MNGVETRKIILQRWPTLRVNCADRVYADGIDSEFVRKFWKRWKFGFLGFGGAPLYLFESQDCDDLVRHFLVRHFIVQFKLKRKAKKKGEAQPMFYTGWNGHAYVSFITLDMQVQSMDLRNGKMCEIESFIVEML